MWWILLFGFVDAHSWLHCVNYDPQASLNVGRITPSACRSLARGIPADVPFGEDRGFNYQPAADRACRNPYGGRANTFAAGQRIRLLWPAKNHVAAPCTNPYITSGFLRLYAQAVRNFSDADLTFSKWTTTTYLVHDFNAAGRKGFQNCPDFCPTTDRVPCFGDVPLPPSLTGAVKFLWVWNFNPNEFFTHCFDAVIGPAAGSKAPTAAGSKAPTAAGSKAPTAAGSKAPTAAGSKAPTAARTCAQRWYQCGGVGWKGATCCVSGSVCTPQNAYYAQCLPK